jgi:tRNA(Ile)-lysidine synthase
MKKEVLDFLKKNFSFKKPLLLALSGGPDSLCLFNICLEIKTSYPFELMIAHVDHGWRKESSQEAEQLKILCESFNVPFYLKKLEVTSQKNLEDSCRQLRLQFFKELCRSLDCEATLLAHHRGDVAETVLKRIFEGSSFLRIASLKPIQFYEGLPLWRPLLQFSKGEIMAWNEKNGLQPFHDVTNLNPKFYRGKCRTQIIPFLKDAFGKEIEGNLSYLSDQILELNQHVEKEIQPFLNNIQKSAFETCLDLSHAPDSIFLIKMILRSFFEKEGFFLSRQQLQRATDGIITSKTHLKFMIGAKIVVVHLKKVKIFDKNDQS